MIYESGWSSITVKEGYCYSLSDSLVISNNNELEIIEIEDGEHGYWDESEDTGVYYNVKNVEISSIL